MIRPVTMDNVTVSLNLTSVDRNYTLDPLAELNKQYALAILPFTIILGMFCIVGVLGNILVFIVYGTGKQFKDQKYRIYVLYLAIVDFVTCLTLVPAEMWKHQSYFDFKETALCKMKCFLNVFAAASATFCLCVVAIDRYIMTCHPFLFVKIQAFSHTVAWRLCALMLFLGVLTAIPSALLCGTAKETMETLDGNTTYVYLCVADPSFEEGISRYAYKVTLTTAQLVISIVIIVLYIKIGLVVMKVMKIREFASVSSLDLENRQCQVHFRQSSGRSEVSMMGVRHHHHPAMPSNVKLLFLVTLVFLLTYFLYVGLMWIDQTRLSPPEFLFFSMFYRLYFVHSIINPFLYAKMDSHFREKCLNILKRYN